MSDLGKVPRFPEPHEMPPEIREAWEKASPAARERLKKVWQQTGEALEKRKKEGIVLGVAVGAVGAFVLSKIL